MKLSIFKTNRSRSGKGLSNEQGFTLMETAVSLVIMMVVGLGVASVFAYATSNNGRADDRELAMAIAQARLEWLRTIPFNLQTRGVAFSYPNGGLAATNTSGVQETVTNAGRSFRVVTVIQDLNFVPTGDADAGGSTLKRIQISVTPLASNSSFDTITVTTQRSTQNVGMY